MKKIRELIKSTIHIRSLLFVEDDDLVRQSAKNFFSGLFDKVTTAKNGEEGIRLCEKETFDLVITDLDMPRMDGLTFIRELRKGKPDQLILVMSAHDEEEWTQPSKDLAIDGYLFKPLDLDRFLAAIGSLSPTGKESRPSPLSG